MMESKVGFYLNELKKLVSTERNGEFIYRGQKSAVWGLQSSAQRRIDRQSKLDNRKFNFNDFVIYHKQIIDKARFLGHDNQGKLSDLDILAEIQHHGGATCLTDFTTNFLVALWFASQDVTNEELKNIDILNLPNDNDCIGKKITNKHGRIFIVNIMHDKNFDMLYPIRQTKPTDRIDKLLEKKSQFNGLKKHLNLVFGCGNQRV
ncbi:MAG: FRG domain-containing protein [Bacteroidota bacterium]|nr:FRG domain-containing protein [Bacteroidota bacterium]